MGLFLRLPVCVWLLQLYDGGFAEFDPVIGVLCGSIPPANCVWLLQLYDGGLAEFDPVIGVLCGSIPPATCVCLVVTAL